MIFDEWLKSTGQYLQPLSVRLLMQAAWHKALMEANPKWIPVDERMPTKTDASTRGEILVWDKGFASVLVFDWNDNDILDDPDITHWIPLPCPPEDATELE